MIEILWVNGTLELTDLVQSSALSHVHPKVKFTLFLRGLKGVKLLLLLLLCSIIGCQSLTGGSIEGGENLCTNEANQQQVLISNNPSEEDKTICYFSPELNVMSIILNFLIRKKNKHLL